MTNQPEDFKAQLMEFQQWKGIIDFLESIRCQQILNHDESFIFFVEVDFWIHVESNLAHKRLLFLIAAVHKGNVHLLVFLVLFLVYLVVVRQVCLFYYPLLLTLVLRQDHVLLLFAFRVYQAAKQLTQSLTHRKNQGSWEQPQLFAICDDIQVFELFGSAEKLFDVGEHIKSAVVSICLPRELNKAKFTRSWQQGRFSSLQLIVLRCFSQLQSQRYLRTAATMNYRFSHILSQYKSCGFSLEFGSRRRPGCRMIMQNQCLKAFMGKTRQSRMKISILFVHLATFLQFSFTFWFTIPTRKDIYLSKIISYLTYSPISFSMKKVEKKKHFSSKFDGKNTKLNIFRQLPTIVSLRSAYGRSLSISSIVIGKVSVLSNCPFLRVNFSLSIFMGGALGKNDFSASFLRVQIFSSCSFLCFLKRSSFLLEVN